MTRRIVILALVACYCLTGCGQKGPLRLPESPVSETEAAEAEQTENERD